VASSMFTPGITQGPHWRRTRSRLLDTRSARRDCQNQKGLQYPGRSLPFPFSWYRLLECSSADDCRRRRCGYSRLSLTYWITRRLPPQTELKQRRLTFNYSENPVHQGQSVARQQVHSRVPGHRRFPPPSRLKRNIVLTLCRALSELNGSGRRGCSSRDSADHSDRDRRRNLGQ
jgi:hypothetical protein